MYRKILVPLDLNSSEGNGKILDTVSDHFAGDHADIHLISVLPHDESLGVLSQFIPEGFEETQAKAAHKSLDQLAASIGAGFRQVECHVQSGNVYVEVLDVAEKISADLIVLGSNKPELKSFLLGPSAARIMRHATCSTLIVR